MSQTHFSKHFYRILIHDNQISVVRTFYSAGYVTHDTYLRKYYKLLIYFKYYYKYYTSEHTIIVCLMVKTVKMWIHAILFIISIHLNVYHMQNTTHTFTFWSILYSYLCFILWYNCMYCCFFKRLYIYSLCINNNVMHHCVLIPWYIQIHLFDKFDGRKLTYTCITVTIIIWLW